MGQGGIFLSRKSPIFYSALILTGVNLLLRFVATTFQVYISSKMGAEGVGLLQLVLSVGSLALTAGLAGIRTATMYLTAAQLGIKKKENITHTLSACVIYSILCSTAVASFLFLFAPKIAVAWIDNSQTAEAIRLYAGFLPVCCLCGVMTGYFTAAGKIKTLAAVEIAEQLVSIGITISLLTLWAKDNSIAACQSVIFGSGMGACVTLLCLTILRIREKSPSLGPFPIWKQLMQTAIPLAVADDLKAGINTAENLMVPKRLSLYPATAAPLAAFGTVCGMVFPVMMFPAAIIFSLAELLIPEIARCNAAGSRMRICYLTRRSLRIVLLYATFACGILLSVSHPLCQKLYESADAGTYLQRYAFLVPILYCDIIIDALNKGLGMQKISVQFNLLTAILDVLFLFILLPKYGMDGYFFSFLLTHLLNFILSISLLLKTVKLHIPVKMPLLTTVSALTAMILSRYPGGWFMRASIFSLSFLSLLVLTQVISREDIRWIRGLIGAK